MLNGLRKERSEVDQKIVELQELGAPGDEVSELIKDKEYLWREAEYLWKEVAQLREEEFFLLQLRKH